MISDLRATATALQTAKQIRGAAVVREIGDAATLKSLAAVLTDAFAAGGVSCPVSRLQILSMLAARVKSEVFHPADWPGDAASLYGLAVGEARKLGGVAGLVALGDLADAFSAGASRAELSACSHPGGWALLKGNITALACETSILRAASLSDLGRLLGSAMSRFSNVDRKMVLVALAERLGQLPVSAMSSDDGMTLFLHVNTLLRSVDITDRPRITEALIEPLKKHVHGDPRIQSNLDAWLSRLIENGKR